jgi:hypothetical protein
LVGKTEGKRLLVRPRRRWVEYIKMDFKEGGMGVWTGLIWYRTVIGGGLL